MAIKFDPSTMQVVLAGKKYSIIAKVGTPYFNGPNAGKPSYQGAVMNNKTKNIHRSQFYWEDPITDGIRSSWLLDRFEKLEGVFVSPGIRVLETIFGLKDSA